MWSYQPPPVSQVIRMAVFCQMVEFCTACTSLAVKLMPPWIEPSPGCMSWPFAGLIKVTGASVPLLSCCVKFEYG